MTEREKWKKERKKITKIIVGRKEERNEAKKKQGRTKQEPREKVKEEE